MSGKVRKRERDASDQPEDYSEYRPKKLRMIVKEKSAFTLLEDVARVDDPRTRQRLTDDLIAHVMLLSTEDILHVTTRLCQLVLDESVSLICLHCLQLVMDNTSSLPHSLSIAQLFLDTVQSILSTDAPDGVSYCKIVDMYRASLLGRLQGDECVQKMMTLCVQAVRHSNWLVRDSSVRFVVDHLRAVATEARWSRTCAKPALTRHEDQNKLLVRSRSLASTVNLEDLLCHTITDRDPRVRATAVGCLLRNTELLEEEGGSSLSCSRYESYATLLHDTDENVRTHALRIVKHLADSEPDRRVHRSNSNISLRLVDHAFSHMCNAVHDLSLKVRTEAALLLGEFQNVSTSFLEQTLDKKLMSRMKFLSSGRSSSVQEWATGRRFGEDAPVEKAEEESNSLIPSGACGAFVTGLEDEHMAVRQAAVRSLSELATGRPTFAAKAVDFLADMFNDEIEQVRLDAVNYLRPLVQHTLLNEQQMQPILNMLDDAMSDSRLALRQLLRDCRFANTSAVQMCVKALLNNLRRYPLDKESVWIAMRDVGRSHGAHILPVVVELLGVHAYLHGPEPTLDNHSYMARLVLVLNAAASCPTIQSLFPHFVFAHYRFLRESSPDLVPQLQPWKTWNSCKLDDLDKEGALWATTVQKLSLVDDLPPGVAQDLLKLIMRDLEKLGGLGGPCQTGAVFMLACCQLKCTLTRLIDALSQNISDKSSLKPTLIQAQSELEAMDALYVCEDVQCAIFIGQCRVRCRVAQMAFNGVTPVNLVALVSSLNTLRDICPRDAIALGVGELVESISGGDLSSLWPTLQQTRLSLPVGIAVDAMQQKRCTITEPEADSDSVIRFVAGLVTAVPLTAELTGFTDEDMVRIRVRVDYPDGRTHHQRPRPNDLRRLSPTVVRLNTNVLLNASLWSHKASVRLSVGLVNESDTWIGLKSNNDSLLANVSSVNVSLFPKQKC